MTEPSPSAPLRRATSRAVLLAPLALLALACGGAGCDGSRLDGAPDTLPDTTADTIVPDADDTSEPHDASEQPDTTAATDTGDAADAADATAEPDANDVAPDVEDADDADDADDTSDATPLSCVTDEDCDASPRGPCERAVCDRATLTCRAEPREDDTACEDGDLCTTGARCDAGACVPAAYVACDDGNACTDDRCDPTVGCVAPANLAACDDGDPCTTGDRCLGGVCLRGAPTCDDDNPCTRDSCVAGVCAHTPDDTLPCSDGSACSAGDRCVAGVCAPGTADGCAVAGPCRSGACADDGLICRFTDHNGVACDDGDACTDGDACVGGSCRPGPPRDCGGHASCATWTCDPALGCELIGTFPGASCDDGDACTPASTCDDGGSCVGLGAVACDDGNPCTTDECAPATGCRHLLRPGPCDDGDVCTADDRCVGTSCGGTPVDCDDGDACSLETCDPLTGCASIPGAVVCDDGDPCTDDRCDPEDGCVFRPNSAPCDDGDACTTGDTCALGDCAGAPAACDDGEDCTVDVCDPEEGCVNVAFTGPCEDGDACTAGETCDDSGVCDGGVPVALDDAVACTIDACTPDGGVTHTPDFSACAVGQRCDRVVGCVAAAPVVMITAARLDAGVDGPEAGYGQWLQLTNAGEAAIDLTGWALRVGTPEVTQVALSATGGAPLVLAPGQRVAAVKATTTPPPEGMAPFALVFGAPGDGFAIPTSGGAQVAVVDAQGALVDVLALGTLTRGPTVGPTAFPLVAGAAMTLDAAALNGATTTAANDAGARWCVPLVAFEPVAPPPDCRAGVLNEIRLGGPDGQRWIELVYPFGATLDDERVVIVQADGDVEDERALLGRMPIGAPLLIRDGDALVVLPRLSDGAVQLVSPDGALRDVYGFGALTEATDIARLLPLQEGAPGPAQGPDDAAERAHLGVDTDDNSADWHTSAGGSPGMFNDGTE